MKIYLELNLDVHAGGQVELHQRVDRLCSWVEDVDEALMGSYLEVEPCILVHVRGLKNTVHSSLGWERDWAHSLCVRCSCSIHYLLA